MPLYLGCMDGDGTFTLLGPEDDRLQFQYHAVRVGPPRGYRVQIDADNSYVDEWGTRWKKPASSLYFDPVDWPLKEATVEDLDHPGGRLQRVQHLERDPGGICAA